MSDHSGDANNMVSDDGWTAEPKQAGWYWYRALIEGEWETAIYELNLIPSGRNAGRLYSRRWGVITEGMGGMWLGPITPTDREAWRANGRVEGLREGINIVERALLCTGRGVFGDGVKAGCKYIRDELTKQIEQAAQGEVKSE